MNMAQGHIVGMFTQTRPFTHRQPAHAIDLTLNASMGYEDAIFDTIAGQVGHGFAVSSYTLGCASTKVTQPMDSNSWNRVKVRSFGALIARQRGLAFCIIGIQ